MDKKALLATINKKAEASKLIPSGKTIIQSVITSIPVIGGALDHLIFDKADEIRLKNIEKTIDDIKNIVQVFNQSKISKEWFESVECMQMFKLLIEKTQYEPDKVKIANLSRVFVNCGSTELVNNPNKFAVMTKIAEMTSIQQKILQVMGTIQPIRQDFSGGDLKYWSTAIWINQIQDKLERGQPFWNGTLMLIPELEFLESFSLTKSPSNRGSQIGYNLTALGHLVNKYLSQNDPSVF